MYVTAYVHYLRFNKNRHNKNRHLTVLLLSAVLRHTLNLKSDMPIPQNGHNEKSKLPTHQFN